MERLLRIGTLHKGISLYITTESRPEHSYASEALIYNQHVVLKLTGDDYGCYIDPDTESIQHMDDEARPIVSMLLEQLYTMVLRRLHEIWADQNITDNAKLQLSCTLFKNTMFVDEAWGDYRDSIIMEVTGGEL